MLDVFKKDAFSTVSMTDAILKAPHKPGRIGALKLFGEKGIRSTTAVVEEKDGQLSLIATSPRGGPGSSIGRQSRKARSFIVPHLERESKVYADEVQDVRQFGSEDAMEAVQAVVDERHGELRQMHEATLEYHRMGAIRGQILDADGATVVYNLFTEFGVAQQTYNFVLSVATTDIRGGCVAVQRLVESELGAEQQVTGYRAFCGDAFFDDFVKHAKVEESLKYQEGKVLRTDLRAGFEFGGITFENYRGKVGAVDFVPTNEAFVVPEGTGIFKTYFAPADFIETVNTIGLPVYSKIAEGELNRWAKVHTQSNPLCLNLRPRAVVKLTKS